MYSKIQQEKAARVFPGCRSTSFKAVMADGRSVLGSVAPVELVRNNNHGRDTSESINQLMDDAKRALGNTPLAEEFLTVIRKKKGSNYQASLTAGTVFHKIHTPLLKWFWAIFLVATDKRGYSALALMKTIDVSYPTAWLMLQKIRAAMSERDSKYQLSGLVQLDEAFFGGPDGKQGRGTDKIAAYVAVSTTDEGKPLYAKIEVTEHVNKETALDFVTRTVSTGSIITTDGLNVYPQLKAKGYVHDRVLSSEAEADEKLHWVHTVQGSVNYFV